MRIVGIIMVFATAAFGAADAHWPTAGKNGFGTSLSSASKVWFTLANGVMTEVFFPTVDMPNVQTLQMIVVTDGSVETELDDTVHRLELPSASSLTFRQVNTAKSGEYTITKTYVTDPKRNTVLIDLAVDSRIPAGLYVYYDPSLNNSGLHDSAWTQGDAMVAIEGNKASALMSDCGPFVETSNGYLGSTDGLAQLRKDRNLAAAARADDGNVVQVGALKRLKKDKPLKLRCTIALGFGETVPLAIAAARGSLKRGFEDASIEYEAEWRNYVSSLPRIDGEHQRQFYMAAMVLRALEDKTFRGAVIASPSTPWGGGPNANEPTASGYHAVWTRDLYHVATAFVAVGDVPAATRVLNYMFRVQQKRDGSFPQNTWVDGRPIGSGLQLDQVGLPLVLAYQLGRTDRNTWRGHVKLAADFIVRHGPRTDQDRWEEKAGYSPASIAAQIAGLVCAARIARINGDNSSADAYLKTADKWTSNIERWTVTRDPRFGSPHYIRITENDDPNDGAKMQINSSSRVVDERTVIDAGFLELVRLGVKAPSDQLIRDSLALVDRLIKVDTPAGETWYRYNYDAYGETAAGGDYDGRNGAGRLWTLLTGERGEYEIAAGDVASARRRLDTMAGFANDGLMIPEQIWDRSDAPAGFRFGAGTGSATPLAWSMAQFIRLAMNIQKGRNLETPRVVIERYQNK